MCAHRSFFSLNHHWNKNVLTFQSYSQNTTTKPDNTRTLAQHCHNIERLDLSDCKKITDQAIYAISKHCAKLTGINLESCVNITDKSLKNVADGCPVSDNTHTLQAHSFTFFLSICLFVHIIFPLFCRFWSTTLVHFLNVFISISHSLTHKKNTFFFLFCLWNF